MIRQDYILKLIEDFFATIGEAIHHAEQKRHDRTLLIIDRAYGDFFGRDAVFFRNEGIDALSAYVESERAEAEYAEMLSELMYRDALCRPDCPVRNSLLDKSLAMAERADSVSGTYLPRRADRMKIIRELLDASACERP